MGNSFRGTQFVTDIASTRMAVESARRRGGRVGVVPTMGALHEGHLSLVRASQRETDFTAVSIFVNPTQFGPHEDLGKYPRTLEHDREMLESLQVDLIFAPAPGVIYHPDHSTFVQPPAVSEPWEGVRRPGHFRGVATVVLKLFQIIPGDVAFFGQKDFQQCRVIEQMVRDFDLPIEVRRCPIVREVDGLAMSSRNRYLSATERVAALSLSRGLRQAERLVSEGERSAPRLAEAIQQELDAGPVSKTDYVAIADPITLEPVASQLPTSGAVALIAAYVGTTRLIDNQILTC